MGTSLKVGVKFCGNCNPHLPAKEVFQEIKEKLIKKGAKVEFVPWDDQAKEILLVLSGCPVDCASRPEGDYEEVVVAGESVNRVSMGRGEIPEKIAEILTEKKKPRRV